MVDKVKSIWMDGQLVPWDDANVHVLTHSFHYGVAAFEGVRAYKRADGKTYIFRLTEHTRRLLDTCRLALMKPSTCRPLCSRVTPRELADMEYWQLSL